MASWTLIMVASCSHALAPSGHWTDQTGEEVSTDVIWSWIGDDSHCDWGSATFLWIGRGGSTPHIDATMYDQYVRDPEGLFKDRWATEFIVDAKVPEDAAFTGYSTLNLELWISPSVTSAVFIEVGPDQFEQWPRALDESPLGVCA